MKTIDLQNILNTKHRGAYLTIVYSKTYKGEYVKTTRTTVRLVNYSAVKKNNGEGDQKPTKVNPNNEYLGNNIIYNKNTQNTLLQVFLTNNPHHRPHSVYCKVNGEEITKEEFVEATGKKSSTPDIMFSINVNDIVMVK